jgi:putative spermidine/putrescine transport system substrate-binding protein
MNKKRIAALLAAAAMTLSCAACGSTTAESETAATTQDNEVAAVETEATTTETTTETTEATTDFGGAELVVATWGWAEAGLKTLAADFETTYNCTIVVDPTSGNGDRLNKLIAEQNDPTADVALLTKSFAETGNQMGLFEQIDTSVVTSLDNLYDFAQNADGYGPSYSVCRYGIMYNADALEAAGLPAPTSYEDLFDDQYAGMVALPDMTSTAGPYMLVAMAEAMGGSQEDITPAMSLMQEKKDNIDLWYTTSSDVVNAFTTGEINIAVFMDINMSGLMDSGLNMVWVDASEGSFAAPATVNVVKNCANPELAQLFVEYLISDAVQDQIAEVMDEAPVSKNATMSDELQVYLAFGEEAIGALKEFDETYITENKDGWIDEFQRTVNID